VKGLVGWYTVRVSDPQDATAVAKAIDDRFANSPWETKTDTEKAFAASFAKQMGNIELLILIVGGVVFLTLLLVTGNTMAIAVRERIAEVAVLKTIGFTDRLVLVLVLAEAALLALVGGVAGVAAAKGMAPGLGKAVPGMIFVIPAGDLGLGVGLALGVGLLAGLFPSLSAMRLKVVDALRKV
jgi:putative ABC transport system permease protein